MLKEVDLICAGGGNLASVRYCFNRLDVACHEITGTNLPQGDKPIVLPGVGAFGAVMDRLRQNGMDQRIKELAKDGVPLLGICVGLQVLFDESEESQGVSGLSLIPGRVVRFTQGKVPQIGWNRITGAGNGADSGFVYFVNSYYPRPENPDVVSYSADYFGRFCAAVEAENITAFQFHPEKSGVFGQSLLRRWIERDGR